MNPNIHDVIPYVKDLDLKRSEKSKLLERLKGHERVEGTTLARLVQRAYGLPVSICDEHGAVVNGQCIEEGGIVLRTTDGVHYDWFQPKKIDRLAHLKSGQNCGVYTVLSMLEYLYDGGATVGEDVLSPSLFLKLRAHMIASLLGENHGVRGGSKRLAVHRRHFHGPRDRLDHGHP